MANFRKLLVGILFVTVLTCGAPYGHTTVLTPTPVTVKSLHSYCFEREVETEGKESLTSIEIKAKPYQFRLKEKSKSYAFPPRASP
jgi:hypothetical protein